MSEKLYYQDPYKQTFTSTLTHSGVEENGTNYVVLAETSFYPTGGGQPCDLGTLNEIEVIDVEEVNGQIRHRLAQPLPVDAGPVTGQIDWRRRFDHMQQHTGQHILSASFDELFGASTVAFHLGSERVTIDIAASELTVEMADLAEALANRIVFENRPIVARFVEQNELASYPLRKAPTVAENIRLVIISDFDCNPCGGTHPGYTGEVGPIKILGWERNKGNTRVEFVCGWRTLQNMSKMQAIVKNVSRQLNSSEADVPEQVSRLLLEKKEMEQTLQATEKKLLDAEARELFANAQQINGVNVVEAVFIDRPMQELQKLAQAVIAFSPMTAVLFATGGVKTQLVFARGSDVNMPMNELLKETLQLIDGKGGGNPASAQGGGNSIRPAQELVDYAFALLKERLL